MPRKILEDRTIYVSRQLPISYGTPVLCDLGEARIATDEQNGDIMPDIYRAPEVILCMNWDHKVDIWNVGMVVRMIIYAVVLPLQALAELIIAKIWDLFEHRHLFRARNPAHKLDDEYHLAEMHAVLGSPPPEFLVRSEKTLQFWDKYGVYHPVEKVKYGYNLSALIFNVIYQVIGKAQLLFQSIIWICWKKD